MDRYDKMQPSTVYDQDEVCAELNDTFPNPLTLEYADPSTYQRFLLKQEDVDRFWLANYRMYGNVNNDDLLLDINHIRYVTQLEAGDIVYGPKTNTF